MPSYFCTATDLKFRLSKAGYDLRLDDDTSAITNVLQRATNETRWYCEQNYDFDDLLADAQDGGWVNDVTADIAAYYLAGRRGNEAPRSLEKLYERTISRLEMVQLSTAQIPGLAERYTPIPRFSNIRVDPGYDIKKVRVEQTISDGQPVQGYTQHPDWRSVFAFEF